jgi:hypothetical protein
MGEVLDAKRKQGIINACKLSTHARADDKGPRRDICLFVARMDFSDLTERL